MLVYYTYDIHIIQYFELKLLYKIFQHFIKIFEILAELKVEIGLARVMKFGTNFKEIN